ncbi:iron uptake system protein EfeO [Rhizobiaceae bacterium BDR2-2]|uniref:Iron uptake system protein EfeO n=1 Tax=Ectorhizobium quercum TaxID=2965071 RepID=A0AAE3MUU5_9HYPH|nr:iron uptake system protein EfeO [Ectorhizobium quercum]MCX8995568.1 iron uptake system protein EfeO [Ectorhizobium quercum]
MSNPGQPTGPAARPPRLMPLAVAGAAALAVAGGALFYYASKTATGPEKGAVHTVTVNAKGCVPNEVTVPAGRTTFEIVNASDRTLEWEILDGVMVVEERENIAPGFRSTLTARLKPGTFEIACGLLSNPRGTLTVTPSADSEAERTKPPLKAFIGPLSEYRVYVGLQSSALVRETEKLAAAIHAGDLDAARSQYAAARLPYKRLESLAGRIADLENRIDPLADYFEKREEDPGFTGFHRIEYGLFSQNATDGLAPAADALAADVAALKDRLKETRLAPDELAATAARQARRLAEETVPHGDNRYGHTDPAEFAANLDGIEKSVSLLYPLVEAARPETAEEVKRGFSDVRALLSDIGDVSYRSVDADARARLSAAFATLAGRIDTVNPALGME